MEIYETSGKLELIKMKENVAIGFFAWKGIYYGNIPIHLFFDTSEKLELIKINEKGRCYNVAILNSLFATITNNNLPFHFCFSQI